MIILIGGEKGGTGKTTLVTNIATIAVNEGKDLIVVDTDKQSSASSWCAVRDENETAKRVPNMQKFGEKLGLEIKNLEAKYGDILIDAGGQNSIELRSALTVANKIFIPVQAGQFDIWTLEVMNNLVTQARIFNPSLLAYVVINRAPTNHTSTEVPDVVTVIDEFDSLQLARTVIHERIAFRKAVKEGLGVTELEKKDMKACSETKDLYKEIYNVKDII